MSILFDLEFASDIEFDRELDRESIRILSRLFKLANEDKLSLLINNLLLCMIYYTENILDAFCDNFPLCLRRHQHLLRFRYYLFGHFLLCLLKPEECLYSEPHMHSFEIC